MTLERHEPAVVTRGREVQAPGSHRSVSIPGRSRGHRPPWASLLLVLLASCTPFGFARGDYWTGISTGDLGPCPPVQFDVTIDEGRIGGSATSEHEWGATLWQVRGLISSGSQVQVETKTEDPRVARRTIQWTGSFNPLFWDLTEAADPACTKPRVVSLHRR